MVTSSALNLINGDTDPDQPTGSSEVLFYVKNGQLYARDVTGAINALLGASASTNMIAGAGLTGGGDLSVDRTFNVNVDNSSIDISADTVQVKDGGITSTKIADGTIVNGDINAAAAIAYSKLANISAVQKILGRYTTGAGTPEEVGLAADHEIAAGLLRQTAWTGSQLTKAAGSTAPTIAAGAITATEVAAANKDGAAGTPSMRTLGTGSTQATAGDDSRLTNSRTPTGAAGGSLTGTYPNPTILANAVTNTELADMAALRIKGAFAAGDPVDLTAEQLLQIINSGTASQTARFLTSNVSITGTTSETILATLTVPANGFVVGATYRAFLAGSGTQTAVATTLNARLRIGGVAGTVAALASRNQSLARTTTQFSADLYFTVRSITAAGTALGAGQLNGPYWTGETVFVAGQNATPVALNSTISNDIVLTFQPSVATFTAGVITTAGIYRV